MNRTMPVRKMFEGHVHWRNGVMRNLVVPFTGKQCYAAVWMPNLNPPIVRWEDAWDYRAKNRKYLPEGFVQIGTGYLTEEMDPENVVEGYKRGAFKALKFYPRSAKHGAGTTGAHSGVTDLRNCTRVLEAMESNGMRLALHGERIDHPKTGEEVDHYDREQYFIDYDLPWLRKTFSGLPISLEHLSTSEGADCLASEGDSKLFCATVTLQHLDLDRRDVFRDGLNPSIHCLPLIKREEHKLALRALVKKGFPFIFAGTDSAPHPKSAKERACGCAAGIFTAHCALQGYTEVFDQMGALEHLEAFTSLNGPRYYGIAPSEERITLIEDPWTQDELITSKDDILWPYGFHGDPDKRRVFKWKIAA